MSRADLAEDGQWVEIHLEVGVRPEEFYESVRGETECEHCDSFHHFWDEPWNPGAYVVRVHTTNHFHLAQGVGVKHLYAWDASGDEKLYGELWPWVSRLFEASSAVSAKEHPDTTLKLVHCLLNARGMSERDEARFAWHFLWNRLLIRHRVKRYYRKHGKHPLERKVAA